MEITREVILDLLPLYLEGEGSPSTRALVEKFLESDPELAKIVSQSKSTSSLKETPLPLSKENAMESYKEARRWMTIRTLGLALIIAIVLMFIFIMIFAAFILLNFRM